MPGRDHGSSGDEALALVAAVVLVEAAVVDHLGADVVPALDLQAVHIEANAALDERTFLAFEERELQDVDLLRRRRQIPGERAAGGRQAADGDAGLEAGLAEDRQLTR